MTGTRAIDRRALMIGTCALAALPLDRADRAAPARASALHLGQIARRNDAAARRRRTQ